MSEEKFYFQTEAAELLQLMIGSVYSNKDIFLRELISNASDALDKRRIETLKNTELAENANPEIKIEINTDNKTLSVSDNGVGMNRDDLINYLGTIAKSGTKEFLKSVKAENKPLDEDLIGKFGVGFYSVFMVSEKVEVVTRKLGDAETFKFTSDGSGSYTIEDVEQRNECGTTVTLFMRDSKDENSDAKNYLDEWTIKEIIHKYSDFISYPVIFKDETINSRKAIWQRADSEITEDEYKEFYKHLTNDYSDPLTHIKINAEGSTNFKGLLFVPSRAPFDLFMNPQSGGVSLYIKRVFIMNDFKSLIPDYLRFIRGVIDSEDLPLNISREILQDDPIIRVIRRSTQRKIFTELKKMLEKDRETYIKFWLEFGRIFKEGVIQDKEYSKKILEIALFKTTFNDDWTTIDEYKSRMKPDQKGIYCLAGRDNAAALKASPKLDPYTEKGYEVLLMTDPVDEVILSDFRFIAPDSDEKDKLLNISDSNVSAQTDDEKKDSEEKIKALEKDFEPLKKIAMEILENKISDVKLSLALTGSIASLTGGMSFQMLSLMRSAGHVVPPQKKVLELNADHSVVKKLISMAKDNNDNEKVSDIIKVLYDQAAILEGASPDDPADFARRINQLIAATIGD